MSQNAFSVLRGSCFPNTGINGALRCLEERSGHLHVGGGKPWVPLFSGRV